VYIFDKVSAKDDNLKFWRCEERGRCKARIHTFEGEVIKKLNVHSHDASAANVEVKSIISKIKIRSEETVESTNQVINERISGMSQASQATLPNNAALRKIIRRKRKEINAVPADPANLQELDIPQSYQQYVP
jgi:hypothetical protein